MLSPRVSANCVLVSVYWLLMLLLSGDLVYRSTLYWDAVLPTCLLPFIASLRVAVRGPHVAGDSARRAHVHPGRVPRAHRMARLSRRAGLLVRGHSGLRLT